MSRPDETKIIDREGEITTFTSLLTLQTTQRVMVVSNRSGMGKTDLLRKMRLHCDVEHSVPVALVHLKDFEGRPEEFALVAYLHKSLKETGAALPNFEALDQARGFRNTEAFLEKVRSVSAAVDMRNAVVSGAAKVAAMMTIIENPGSVVLPPWSDETDAQARALCVEAFLSDLNGFTKQQSVALLFDGLNEVGEYLRRWILTELVKRIALDDWQNRRLVVVLSGEDVQELVYGRLPAVHHDCIQLLTSFEQWDAEQVKAFLEVNGFSAFGPKLINVAQTMLTEG